MPKMLIASAPRLAEFKEYTDRKIEKDEIKCKILYASPKHGTELTDFRAKSPFIEEKYDEEWQIFVKRNPDEKSGVPFGEWNLGNQWIGKIIEKGEAVQNFEIGDLISSYGGIRETQIIKAVDNFRCRKLPNESLWKNALCYDPAQFALGGVRDSHIRPGDSCCIYGLGAIGQIAMQLCVKLGSYPVIVVDPIERRREIALKNGAHFALDPSVGDIGLEIKKLTDKKGVDVIIETSGHVSALQSGLKGLAYGGTISYVAFAKEFNGLNFGREAHFNAAKIVFARACSEPLPDYPRWSRRRIEDTCWRMLVENYINCEDIIDPVVSFEDCAEGYMEFVDRKPELSIKLGIQF